MLWGLMDNSQSTLSHSNNYTRRIWLRGKEKEGLCFLRTKSTLWLQSLHTFHEDLSGTICLLAGLSQTQHPCKYLYIIHFLYLSRWISIDWTFTIKFFIGSRFTNLCPQLQLRSDLVNNGNGKVTCGFCPFNTPLTDRGVSYRTRSWNLDRWRAWSNRRFLINRLYSLEKQWRQWQGQIQ